MLAELRRGPRGAEVTRLQILDPGEAVDAKTGTFIIRFTT
jgi:hypothetical protein